MRRARAIPRPVRPAGRPGRRHAVYTNLPPGDYVVVARDATATVLSDPISVKVEEGRIAYRNIRNVVYLLTAAGIAEVVTVGLAVLAGLPLPLLPVQLLWLNLVTNGVQDVGLAFERGTGDELRAPPRPRSAASASSRRWAS